MKVELGDMVQDKISGIAGVAVARTDWLFGCRRITLQPKAGKDKKLPDSVTIDEPQCEIVRAGFLHGTPAANNHGTRFNPGRNPDPVR